MHSKFLALISLSMYLGSCCCSSGTKTITPLNCSNNSFNCGDLAYISYPFWGGAQPSECGLQGYEIVCKNNTTPTLKISSLSYRITNLDFTTNTLTVAREDLLDTYCPDHPHNTTIDWNLFYYPLDSTDRNLTLFYNCTAHSSALPNAFTCANRTSNLFSVTDAPGNGVTCDANIYVPIDFRNAQSLQNPTPSSINILHLALTDGFSIRWYEYKQQRTIRYCNSLLNASCSPRNPNKMYRSCNNQNLCTRGYAAPVPSPTSSARDMAPVPTHPSEYGLPPASSTHYHPQGRGRNPHNERSDGGGKRAKEIIIVVALGVAGIITMSISIHCFQKRRHSPNQQCKHDMEKFLLQQGSLTPKRYRYSEIKKITKFFSHKLGQGGYGSVYKGLLPDGCPVAVKTLTDTDSNGEEFVNEVASISRTCHVNIVALLGFCYESNRRALVYEFMPNSSLDKFLNHNQSAGIMDLEKLYMIAVGVAKGLEYLHNGCNTRIIHFDIKPQNILLDEDLCPKISDFGLAKLCKKKQSILSVLGTRGTAGYIAPEVFSRNFGEVSHKSDVYSYGMMLLEMAGAGKDGEAEAIQSSENYISDKIYEEVIVDDLMMTEGEEETRKKMFVVGFWCIQTIPSSRPSISKVVEMLEGSLEAIQIPPKPFLFSPNLPIHEISSSLSAFVEAENSAQCLDAS